MKKLLTNIKDGNFYNFEIETMILSLIKKWESMLIEFLLRN